MNDELKNSIEQTIKKCLHAKFEKYTPKNNYMPFHYHLLGRDRLALYSFIHSLNTTFGASVFEPVAAALAKERFTFADSRHVVGNEMFADCGTAIDNIMTELEISKRTPDRAEELSMVRVSKPRLTYFERFFCQTSPICCGNNLFIAQYIGRSMTEKSPEDGGRGFDTRTIYTACVFKRK